MGEVHWARAVRSAVIAVVLLPLGPTSFAWGQSAGDGFDTGAEMTVGALAFRSGGAPGETITHSGTDNPVTGSLIGFGVEDEVFRDRFGVKTISIVEGAEIQVNTFTSNNQERQQIATLADGGWVVVWQSQGQDGSGWGVFQQRFDSDGAPVGGETQVNVYTDESQSGPQIAALAGGGWVVAWNSWGQDGNASGVFLQAYSAEGTALGERQVNIATHLSQQDPLIAALQGGDFVVYWMSQEADGTPFGTFRIYHRLYDASGNSLSGERETGANIEDQLGALSVAALEGGGWVATFSNAGLGTDVFQEAYSATGSTLVNGAQVNSHTENNQYDSQVAALEGGGWIVTWQSLQQDGDGWGIYQQRYNQIGQASGGETRVNSTTAGNQQRQQVMGLKGGGWVVAWSSGDQLNPLLFQQAYDANGIPAGGETLLNAGLIGGINFQRIAALDGGGWVVVWHAGTAGAGNINVHQRVFGADGEQIGNTMRVNDFSAGLQAQPQVTTIEDGWVVVWQSEGQDGSGFGVYMKVFRLESTE